MKKYLLSGFLLSIISIHINSADYEMRSEFIYCNLNDGKTLNDAAAVSYTHLTLPTKG